MQVNVEFWRRVQAEHAEWQLRNFGHQEPWQMLLGVVEEVGEMRDAQTTEEEVDAVGDALIFLISFCSAHGFDMGDVATRPVDTSPLDRSVASSLGRLAHHTLKLSQGIRGGRTAHLAALREECARALHALSAGQPSSVEPIVQDVWDVVKLRNWRKDSTNG